MKHLLTADISRDEAIGLLDAAEEMHEVQSRQLKKLPALRGRTVVNAFFENSTRTRSSFEIAGKWLSADVINVSGSGSSVAKGESLRDTVLTLAAMGIDGIVIRHGDSGAPALAANWLDQAYPGVRVLNAGDGAHEHPTQALLDAFALRRRVHGAASRAKDLEGVKVTIVGDIAHSRVARSNALLLPALGAEVTFVAPPTLLPTGIDTWQAHSTSDFDEALSAGPDAVMMLRVQLERQRGAFVPSVGDYILGWSLTDARMARLPEHTVVMHPGPMNRGLEISSRAAESLQSAVLEQVTAGVSVRMAALYSLIAGEEKA